jgi:hypothetical protein
MQIFNNIKLPINFDENQLKKIAEKKLNGKLKYFKILKKSIDARDKGNIFYVYNFEADIKEFKPEIEIIKRISKVHGNIIIVGSGPCGLFCALQLIEKGIKPIIIERGSCVEERTKIITDFFNNKTLNENCNIQFGEGGAGTFSDGKLNTGTKNPLNKKVLEWFVKFGAPEEILYLNKPHIGSDILKSVIKNIRNYIESEGGKYYFDTLLKDIEIKNYSAKKAVLIKKGKIIELEFDELILATGHSSRDTYEMLHKKGVCIEQKNFAVGLRIEHKQDFINYSQYGKSVGLPPADYKLVNHTGNRAVFTFCMCPGGIVIPATSETGSVVTNGMSNYARNEENANSAIIIQIDKNDFKSEHPLSGIEFQRDLERKAFKMGNNNYQAPVQLVGDFLCGKASKEILSVKPSYLIGYELCNLKELFNIDLYNGLKNGIIDMDKRIKGFANYENVLTGIESRTSSPVRITRNEKLESINTQHLYPCGEGAGYAGGITSSATDGIKVALVIAEKY